MRVVVFGANGPTGRILTRRLLAEGHHTVAVTRHPELFDIRHEALTVTTADATDPAAVRTAIAGADAVASLLGTPFGRKPITLYSHSASAITAAMTDAGIPRLVVTSSAAVTDWVDPAWKWYERRFTHRVLGALGRTLYDDMRRMEDIVARTELRWTVMRPLGLAELDAPTTYEVAVDHIPGRQTARRDLAEAIIDRLHRDDYVHQAVAVATTNKSLGIGQTIWREGIRPKLHRR